MCSCWCNSYDYCQFCFCHFREMVYAMFSFSCRIHLFKNTKENKAKRSCCGYGIANNLICHLLCNGMEYNHHLFVHWDSFVNNPNDTWGRRRPKNGEEVTRFSEIKTTGKYSNTYP